MRFERSSAAALVLVMGMSCDGTGLPEQPSWAGMYTVRADTVRYCTETTTATGRTCDCTAPGHLEGTFNLSADAAGKPTGEVHLRECPPGATCGALVAYEVVEYQTSNPNPPSGLSFCAGHCGFAGNDGGIRFSGAPIPANPLQGFFGRNDGNVRGCGSDSGPFTATKQ